MLWGVAQWLARQGNVVSVVSRHERRAAGSEFSGRIDFVAVDYRNTEALVHRVHDAIEQKGPIALALFWIRSDAPEAFQALADEIARAHGAGSSWRLFHVRGSQAHELPDAPPVPANCRYRQVLLGFVNSDAGSRWLSHEEIASGVIRAINSDAEKSLVGTWEPWENRPQ